MSRTFVEPDFDQDFETKTDDFYESDEEEYELDDFEDEEPQGFYKERRFMSRNGKVLQDEELEYDLAAKRAEFRDYLRGSRRYVHPTDPLKLTPVGLLAESGHSLTRYPSALFDSVKKRFDVDDLEFEASQAYDQADNWWRNFSL